MLQAVRITDWTIGQNLLSIFEVLSFVTYLSIEILKYGHVTQIGTLMYNFYCKN